MSEFEIQIAILETSAAVSDQFQFWMAATFAVVVACYTADERLSKWMRGTIALIYLVAVAMFYFRYLDAADQVMYYVQLLETMESDIPVRRVETISSLRKLLMLGGASLALFFIFSPLWISTRKPKNNAR